MFPHFKRPGLRGDSERACSVDRGHANELKRCVWQDPRVVCAQIPEYPDFTQQIRFSPIGPQTDRDVMGCK